MRLGPSHSFNCVRKALSTLTSPRSLLDPGRGPMGRAFGYVSFCALTPLWVPAFSLLHARKAREYRKHKKDL